MLKQLNVRNFALIQQATLIFDKGYTVITGETGSGKSILLNALQLILGERADFKVIGAIGDKAVVEATFIIDKNVYSTFFADNDIDFEPETIVRREITQQGKSRAFINDTPVQLSILKSFTEQLISIHSQYNTLDLKRRDFQIQTLDVLADTTISQKAYLEKYNESKSILKTIEQEKEKLSQLEKDKDYTEFQLAELTELNIEQNNFALLEENLSKIENSSEIQQFTNEVISRLNNDNGVIDQLQFIKSVLSKLTRIDKSTEALENRIQSIIIEVKDIENELTNSIDNFESVNEAQKLQLIELLDKYNRIVQKHHCSTQEELKQLFYKLKESVLNTEEIALKVDQLESEYHTLISQTTELANQLHQKRLNAIDSIEQKIIKSLIDLKLPDTQLKFSLEQSSELNSNGNSILRLLFSANKGFSPIEIEKAASGGELSRVMLALQQLISEKSLLPTIFFDEIDTGVSGDVAQKIGNLLQQMGKTMQLFAISHLPQVAAKAAHHFKVDKTTNDNLTLTTIQQLNENERIEEIARLMSGETINEAAISNAKALMK